MKDENPGQQGASHKIEEGQRGLPGEENHGGGGEAAAHGRQQRPTHRLLQEAGGPILVLGQPSGETL